MKIEEIKDFRQRTAAKIARGQLHEALSDLSSLNLSVGDARMADRLESLARNYRYMLDYFARGAADPGRDQLLADTSDAARALCDELTRRALMAENPTLYFNTARNCGVRRGESVASLLGDYLAEERRLNEDYASAADPMRRRRAESLMSDLFARIWTTFPLAPAELDALGDFLRRPGERVVAAQLAVSALGLGLMEYFEPARMELLLRVYMDTESEDVAVRALVGFLTAAFRYRRRRLPRPVMDALAAAKDSPRWAADFKAVALEMLRTRDTERVSRKLRDEIYPALMKLGGAFKDKIGDGDLDIQALAEGGNPEWEELLSRDGVGDKLKEMTEMQAEGSDVYMSTFSNLKTFPFFTDIAAWFMPFHDEHTAVASFDGLEGSVGEILQRMPMLCDSDKFSAVLAMAQMPGRTRGMKEAMSMQNDQAREMLSELEKADSDGRRKNRINKYIQNLYRFYALFRRKGEFFNPFAHGINLLEVESVAGGFDDLETLEVIGAFCFRHRLWDEAARILERVDRMAEPVASRSQQIGYCYESMGENDRALARYDEANLLDAGSRWTLRRLAAVWRRAGRPDRAVEYYRALAEQLPDDLPVTLNLGYALTEAGRMEEAEAAFHKAVYLDPASVKARRGLAWAQFVLGKLDAATESYAFVITNDNLTADYLNAGHVARAKGMVPEALNFYKLWMTAGSHSPEQLAEALEQDAVWLERAGLRSADNNLYIETIKSQSKW